MTGGGVLSIREVNALEIEQFEWLFGNVIEHCSEAARAVALQRPFATVRGFKKAFGDYLDALDIYGKESVLLSHPDLAGKLCDEKKMTQESESEQNIAGINAMTREERFALNNLNQMSFDFLRMTDELNQEEHEGTSHQHDHSEYDLNGDGKISYIELKAMTRDSDATDDISPTVMRLTMHKADVDESGYLDYPEFMSMVQGKDRLGVFERFLSQYVDSVVPNRPPPTPQLTERPSLNVPDRRYEKEYRFRPPPLTMIIISIIEIILYIYDKRYGRAGELFTYQPTKRYEVWRYLTYMFVHNGTIHLVGNLLVQIMLGIPLEMVHRWWRVLIIYLAGVIAGSLGTSVVLPFTSLNGASSGVYALMTAHLAAIIMNWQQMKWAVLQIIGFGILATLHIIPNIYHRYVLHETKGIGYDAHLAGALAGLLVGINVLRNLKVTKWERVVWWVSILTYTTLMTAAILWNICRTH
ncbi:rhomboid-related protein 1-like isoform X2 [Diachasmimorpha longicaudata]|uniref:rhomboid-related protein 1-like isoform X2 n=1 Tax=Diachasmimorpha longicaudata TaxID=58733 RepID=UPI0030B8C5EF